MNRIQLFISLFVIALLGAMTFSSCSNDEGLPPYDNPNLSDTSGKNINLDLFITGEINSVPFTYYNGRDGYSNIASSGEEGFCGSGTDRFVQFHTTAFILTETTRNTFYIDFKGCLSNDSIVESSKVDSVLVVGTYPFAPKTKEYRNVVIRYYDNAQTLWSTSYGPNASSSSSFELSAVTDNGYDVFSEKIAFGRFEGLLYNGSGESLNLKIGKFKARIVQ